MKRVLVFALLISCISFAKAQNFELSYNDSPIASNDTVSLRATSTEFVFSPVIRNTGFLPVVARIHAEKENTTTTEVVSICTFMCLDGNTSAPFTIAAQSEYTSTQIDFEVPADAATGIFKISVYDTSNTSNRFDFYVKMHSIGSAAAIATAEGNASITAYPNPAHGEVSVAYSGASDGSSIALYNMAGAKVRETAIAAGDGTAAIDLSQLPQGVYLCRLAGTSGVQQTTKIVVR